MISQEFTRAALANEQFAANLAIVAAITESDGVEAAFTVYTSVTGEPRFSEVIQASGDGHLLSARESITRPHTGIMTLDNIVEDLSADKVRYRSDLAMDIHSHTGLHVPKRSAILRPSTTDLEQYDEMALRNTGLIDGVVVVEEDLSLASLLLYRRTDMSQPNRYQQLSGNPTKAAIFRAMDESGFMRAILQFDPASGQFIDGNQAINDAVSTLF